MKRIKIISIMMTAVLIINAVAYVNSTKSIAAPTECNHNWIRQIDEGHYEYQTLIGIFCGCKFGPTTDAGQVKHIKEVEKKYGTKEALNHSGFFRDGTKITVLRWVVDTNYKCSICGATKQEEKEKENNVVDPPVTVQYGSGNYRVTNTAKRTVQYISTTSGTKPSASILDTVKVNGVTFKVTSIAPKALRYHEELKKVTIGKYVSKIGKNCFYGCKGL